MSTLKLSTKFSRFIPVGTKSGNWSPRKFVTCTTPLKTTEDNSKNVKEAAESVKNAADSVSKSVKEMSNKVSETADVVKEKAAQVVSLGAAKIATEIVKKKNEMKNGEKNNKK